MNLFIDKDGNKFYCKDPIDCKYDTDNPYWDVMDRCFLFDSNTGKQNLLHRIGGPAVEYADGEIRYFYNGLDHRDDGPAIHYPSGSEYWYYHGEEIRCKDTEEFLKIIKMRAFI